MSWKQNINIKIAERFYPLKVEKEEDEERIRKAGRWIDDRMLQFRQRYGDRDIQDFLAVTALEFAVKTVELEAKASSTEQADRLEQLNGRLDIFLKQYTDS